MLRVVLADDEQIILNGLLKMIKWEDFGTQVVATATDGEKALDAIREYHPNIVITDVKMPKMTGLEVYDALSDEEKNKIKFIYVSAYQEFDYVKAALSKGAVDYLLKPVRRADLEKVIDKAVSQIDDQNTVDIFKEDKLRPNLKDMFNNMDDGYQYTKNVIYEAFSKTEFDLEDKILVALCVGILSIGSSLEKSSYEKQKLMRFVIYNKIREYIVGENTDNGFVVRKDDTSCNLVAIIDRDKADTFVEDVIISLKHLIEEEYDVTLCIGIGSRTSDIEKINISYSSAKFAYDLYYFEGDEIIDIEKINLPQIGEGEGIDEYNRLAERVFSSVATKNDNLAFDIRSTLMQIKKIHYGNKDAAMSICLAFTGKLFEKLKNFDFVHGDFAEHQETLLKEMNARKTYDEMTEYLTDYYDNLMFKAYQNVQAKDVSVIVQVKEYLHENYMQDISLKQLADMACVSPSYFSTFFKTATGENYKSYLIAIRMEEAVKLVINTDLKTYEIAERVGYNNVRRFVDAFKTKYGASPMEYRKKYK